MPPNFVDVPHTSVHMFLIGPIRGAPDWQNPNADWFLRRMSDIYVASPRSEMWNEKLPDRERRKRYLLQETWEHVNIEAVLDRIRDPAPGRGRGVIYAWHPKEVLHLCSRAYAQTTRIEVGLIMGSIATAYGLKPFTGYGEKDLSILPPDGIFVGAEEGYSGHEYLGDLMNNHRRPLYASAEEMREAVCKYLRD